MAHPPPRIPLLLSLALCAATTAAAQNGAFGNPTGRPIGGHEGYGDWVDGTVVVGTLRELIRELHHAHAGTVVYVRDDAEIDLTGAWDIEIRPGVTLASGRGRNGSLGARLFTTRVVERALFLVTGTNTRITGLRLQGPDTGKEPVGDCGGHDNFGIRVVAPDIAIWHVEIDNNELWGWPQAAVSSSWVYGVHVHHNHIHHNRRKVERDGCRRYNLGYGIVVSDAGWTLAEANLFDTNCHDIACDGKPGTAYEARYNLVLDGGVGHSFDVHGGGDRGDGTNIAGTLFWVHHNTFQKADRPAFNIRGYPLLTADVWANEFIHDRLDDAVQQGNTAPFPPPVNFHVHDNSTSVDYRPGWFVSYSGDSFWRLRRLQAEPLAAILIGDFDGDGRSDAVKWSDGELAFSNGAIEPWTSRNLAPVPISDYRVGDFDGDGRSDLFYADGTTWWVSRGGNGAWEPWKNESLLVTELAFGDFDGDRRTDVFKTSFGEWYVSWGGRSEWNDINTSSYEVSSLRFFDFDGDGRTDVFRTTGTRWFVSRGGTGPWSHWNDSQIPLDQLGFGDFDGDGRVDAFYGNGSQWWMSSRARGGWQPLQSLSARTPDLRFADFNGDRRCDVLVLRNSP